MSVDVKTVTIATHNGCKVAFGHNRRDKAIVVHESHIDPHGKYEIWLDKDLRQFYRDTFGAAQVAFDSTARADRRVGDYLDKLSREAAAAEIENEKIRERNKVHEKAGEKKEKLKVAKKPVYEMIAGVYPQDGLILDEDTQREMLRTFVYGDKKRGIKSWDERNPGLRLVGVYYHADEPDAEPHVHVDYVPVAEMSRGMKVQNSLEGALNRAGIKSGKVTDPATGKATLRTAQVQWQDRENALLQGICEGYGLDVIHPQRGKKSKHKSTSDVKRETALRDREADLQAKEVALEESAQELAQEWAAIARRQQQQDEDKKRYDEACAALDRDRAELERSRRDASEQYRIAQQQAQEAVRDRQEAASELQAATDDRRTLKGAVDTLDAYAKHHGYRDLASMVNRAKSLLDDYAPPMQEPSRRRSRTSDDMTF